MPLKLVAWALIVGRPSGCLMCVPFAASIVRCAPACLTCGPLAAPIARRASGCSGACPCRVSVSHRSRCPLWALSAGFDRSGCFECHRARPIPFGKSRAACAHAVTTLSDTAPLAQLDRASVYGTEGREFESLRARYANPLLRQGFRR